MDSRGLVDDDLGEGGHALRAVEVSETQRKATQREARQRSGCAELGARRLDRAAIPVQSTCTGVGVGVGVGMPQRCMRQNTYTVHCTT
jgi:hypothetical protein